MSFVIDNDMYEWLAGWQLLKITQVIQQLPNGKLALDESATTSLLNGTIFSKILQKVIETSSKSLDKSMIPQTNIDGLKTATKESSKLYNWNVVCDTLKKLQIDIDQDVKNLVVAGDTDMINDLLRELYFKVKRVTVSLVALNINVIVNHRRIQRESLKASPNRAYFIQRVLSKHQL